MPLVKRITITFFISVLLSVAIGYFKGVDIFYLKSIEDYKFEKLYLNQEEYGEMQKDKEQSKNLVHERTFHLKSALIFGTIVISLSSLLLLFFDNKKRHSIKIAENHKSGLLEDSSCGMSAEAFKSAKMAVKRIADKESNFDKEIERAVAIYKKLASSFQHKGDALLMEYEFRSYFIYVAVYTDSPYTYETYFSKYPVLY